MATVIGRSRCPAAISPDDPRSSLHQCPLGAKYDVGNGLLLCRNHRYVACRDGRIEVMTDVPDPTTTRPTMVVDVERDPSVVAAYLAPLQKGLREFHDKHKS